MIPFLSAKNATEELCRADFTYHGMQLLILFLWVAVVKIRWSASATFLELTGNLITLFNTCEPKMCLSKSTAVLAGCEFNTFNTSLSFQTRYNSSVKKSKMIRIKILDRWGVLAALATSRKGWLAIAKLKPLSLFISLLSIPKKVFDNVKIEKWKVKVVSALQ